MVKHCMDYFNRIDDRVDGIKYIVFYILSQFIFSHEFIYFRSVFA